MYFATNIEEHLLEAFQIAALYRARWQVEFSFRILKGFCSLKKCITLKRRHRTLFNNHESDRLSTQDDHQSAITKSSSVEISQNMFVQGIGCHFMNIIQFAHSLDSERCLAYLTSREKHFRTIGNQHLT